MLKRLLCLLLILGCVEAQAGCRTCKKRRANTYIKDKLTRHDKRYGTLTYALELMEQRGAKTIVETGTSRSGAEGCEVDGCSTLIFSKYVKKNGGEFYSVDINQYAVHNARNALRMDNQYVNLVVGDSIEFLEDFEKPIDFLYLDSCDSEPGKPESAQEHHLKEIKAAYPWLIKDSIVMIDDHDQPNGGQAKLVIAYLLERDWFIVAEGYQVILVQR